MYEYKLSHDSFTLMIWKFKEAGNHQQTETASEKRCLRAVQERLENSMYLSTLKYYRVTSIICQGMGDNWRQILRPCLFLIHINRAALRETYKLYPSQVS